MTISAAQFQTWLETPHRRRCALFELTFLGAGVGSPVVATEYQAFVSNMPYVTAGDQTPANQIFDDCVLEIPSFTRRMNEQLTGRSTQNYGDLIIANPSGDRDDWYSMNWDGRRVRQWLGDPSWDFADFQLVLDGIISDVFDPGGGKVGFKIGDKAALFDRPIMTTVLGGSGPEAGGLMPLAYGYSLLNIKPKLIDSTNQIYRVSTTTASGLVEDLTASGVGTENPYRVREDGVLLSSSPSLASSDAGTDLLTSVGHGFVEHTRINFPTGGGGTLPAPLALDTNYWVIASGLTADDFKLSATRGGSAINITGAQVGTPQMTSYGWTNDRTAGTFQLAGSPLGVITCDIWGLGIASASVPTAGGVIEQVMTSSMTNTPFTSADIDAASLTAFKALCPQKVGIYITERMTFSELLDKLVLSVGGWWGFGRAGSLQFGRLGLPVGGSPIYSFSADDIALRTMKMSRRILPRAAVKLTCAINWTVQPTTAGALTSYVQEFYAAPYDTKTGNATFGTWQDDPANHIGATQPAPYETLLWDTVGDAEADTEADRLATLFQYPTAIFSFQTHQAVYLLQLGDEIYVEHSKFTGYGIVVGIVERVKGRSDIEFFCQLPDIYPTEDLA